MIRRAKEGSGKLKVLETIRGSHPFEIFKAKIGPHLGAD